MAVGSTQVCSRLASLVQSWEVLPCASRRHIAIELNACYVRSFLCGGLLASTVALAVLQLHCSDCGVCAVWRCGRKVALLTLGKQAMSYLRLNILRASVTKCCRFVRKRAVLTRSKPCVRSLLVTSRVNAVCNATASSGSCWSASRLSPACPSQPPGQSQEQRTLRAGPELSRLHARAKRT